MKKLTALVLSAAIAPALALSTAAFAEDRDDDMHGGEQRADQEGAGMEQDRDGMEHGMERDDQEGADMERDRDERGGQEGADTERDRDEHDGQERAGEQHLSGKPAGAFYADDVIGNKVKHRGSDENVGEIQDLIIGEDGRIVGVVVKSGGFLGLGGQNVGLGWDHVEHTMEDDESVFYTDMDKETLRNAPEYERD